jgi:hypothetical protein
MNPIEAAILRTVLYADLFNFPLTIPEIHHFLIHNTTLKLDQIKQCMEYSDTLRPLLRIIDGYVVYGERDELVNIRQQREMSSRKLWPVAVRYGTWLARLPFVRMVALTGALAMHNAAGDDDDLDYILVTAQHRVWLARAFSIVLVRLARLQGTQICPNYVLAESALVQEKHDIFIAHEVVQMVPLYGYDLYDCFRSKNAWVAQQLPNANGAFYQEVEVSLSKSWQLGKNLIERLLAGGMGNWLEKWEYRRKLRRFAPEMQKPHSSAKLDDNHVKGHFNDHGHPVLQRFYQRLEEYGLEMTPVAAPGD